LGERLTPIHLPTAKVEDWSVPKVEAESRNVLTSEVEA
jgi:hypothetical protein